MSPSSLRAIAAGVAAFVAVLTGILAGLTGGGETCTTIMSAEKRPGEIGPLKPEDTSCEKETFNVVPAAAGFVGAAVAGGVVLVVTAFVRPPAPVSVPSVAVDNGRVAALEVERDTLVKTAVYVRDRANSKAIADRLGWALSEVGVATVSPVGVKFDPAQHEAGGSAAAPDPAQAGLIAAVEVPGYTDRGTVLRAPVVTVYRDGK
ncbi:nucleotide exchange factor GrpE [Longispora sp. NPDC051575]|uniref:nucleotide exchange factor GrpE n=1 Tax=Longispora sp. NPDC051575 TaxID=3154943 RepID=UPI003445651B